MQEIWMVFNLKKITIPDIHTVNGEKSNIISLFISFDIISLRIFKNSFGA